MPSWLIHPFHPGFRAFLAVVVFMAALTGAPAGVAQFKGWNRIQFAGQGVARTMHYCMTWEMGVPYSLLDLRYHNAATSELHHSVPLKGIPRYIHALGFRVLGCRVCPSTC